MKNAQLMFLQDLEDGLDITKVEKKNGHIISLEISFSPSKIPESVTNLKLLQKITTTYTYPEKYRGESLIYAPVRFYEIRVVPNYLKPYLGSGQIRGYELWENEYDAMKKLDPCGNIYFWNAMEAVNTDDTVQECTMMILNGHVKYFRLDVETFEEFDALKDIIQEFSALENIRIGDCYYNGEIPPWLRLIVKNVEK